MAIRTDSFRGGGTGRGAYVLTPNATTQVPLTIDLLASQTADGFRVRNSTGTTLFSVDASGNITIAGNITAVINETLTGNVSLTGTLSVTGTSTLTGAVTLSSSLAVNGQTTLRSATASQLIVNELVVSGLSTLQAATMVNQSADPQTSVSGGSIYTKTTSGIVELYYKDSAGTVIQITDTGALEGASLFWDDDEYIRMGNTAATPDTRLGWNTAQTVDGLYLGLSDGQNTFIIAENGDRAYDFAHGAQTNPTVYLQSAAQSATEFSAWNAGKISFGLGIATVATDYVVGRNADGTNLLQFNIPTGASFEFSVNDVAQMTMSATAVNFQDNSLTTTGGGSLTGTWTDLGIVTTVDINGGSIDGTTIGGAAAAAGTFTAIVGTSLDLNGALDLDVAALGATITNTADTASSQITIFEGDRATIADGDEAYLTFRLSDSGGTQDEGARITWKATTVLSGATQDTDLIFSALVNNVLTTMLTLDGSASEIVPAVAINSAAAITGTAISGTTGTFSGNVGIGGGGVSSANLEVVGTIVSQIIRNTSDVGYTSLRLYNNQNLAARALEIDYTGSAFAGSVMTGAATGEAAGITTTGAYALYFGTTNTARMAILSGGVVTVGAGTAAYGRLGQLFEINTTANYGGQAINTWTTTALEYGLLEFNRSKSAAIGTHAVVVSGDGLGQITFRGSDAAAGKFVAAASIEAYVDGTPGVDNMPGRLIFSTTPDGSNNQLERMRINSAGKVGIGGASDPLQIVHITSATPILRIDDTTAYNGNPTSKVNFATKYNAAGGYDTMAQIVGGKENITDGNGQGFLSFWTNTSLSTQSEKMRIASDGDVGIGTVTPQGLLDVNSRFVVNTTAKTLTDAATNLFEVALTAGTMTGGSIIWTIEASDGTDYQALSGVTTYAAVNKAGVYTTTVNNNTGNDSKAVSAGTLTAAWDILTGANKVTLRVTPTGSLAETTYRISYTVSNNNAQAITIL